MTDGPYAEGKELLAGYRTIDVESARAGDRDRGPGVGGTGSQRRPIRQPIEVREIMGAPDPEV